MLADTGVPLAAWQDLMARMKRARFGVMFFGTGLAMTRGKHLNTEALLAVVRDMNAYTRFVAKSMRGAGNVTGADNVLAWRTGFAFAVNLARGYPRFNPGEYTADEMLARGEADAGADRACDTDEDLRPRGPAASGRHAAHRAGPSPHGGGATARPWRFTPPRPASTPAARSIAWTRFRCPCAPAIASPLPSDVEILAAHRAPRPRSCRHAGGAVDHGEVVFQNRRRHRLRSDQRHRRPGARPVDLRRQDRRRADRSATCGPIARSTLAAWW